MSIFVTIEGIEGAGKSTLQSHLASWIRSLGHCVLLTKEPGATAIGQKIREILLDPKNGYLPPLVELLLFTADRTQHVHEVIRPALAKGSIVICDRFIHSTLAYQGFGRGMKRADIEFLTTLSTEGLRPDLVLLLDLKPQVGLARAKSRSMRQSEQVSLASPSLEWNRFEEQSLEFHQRVRDGFLELAKIAESKMVIINAEQHQEKVLQDATSALRKLLVTKGIILNADGEELTRMDANKR